MEQRTPSCWERHRVQLGVRGRTWEWGRRLLVRGLSLSDDRGNPRRWGPQGRCRWLCGDELWLWGHSSSQGCVTLAGCSHQSPVSVRPHCGAAARWEVCVPAAPGPQPPTLGASGPGCGTSCSSPGGPPTPQVSLSPKQQRARFSQGAVHTSEVTPWRVSQLQWVAAQWEGGWRLLGGQDSP